MCEKTAKRWGQRYVRDVVLLKSDAIAIVSYGVAMQSVICSVEQRCIHDVGLVSSDAVGFVPCTSAMQPLCMQKRWIRYKFPPLRPRPAANK